MVYAELTPPETDAEVESEEVVLDEFPRAMIPPATPPDGTVLRVEFFVALAAIANLSKVFPEDGALIDPTIPFAQCFPVVCEQ